MAQRIKIELVSQPTPFALLSFTLNGPMSPYYRSINKSFLTGLPTNSGSVQIGGSLAETIQRLFDSFVMYNTDPLYYFTLESGSIYINFLDPFDVVLSAAIEYPWLVIELESLVPLNPDVLPPLVLNEFQIEIIDTYENDRLLIEETTQANAPVLTYDGGDDIFEPFMSSTLNFNMLVADRSDAKFIHLFTGDENRFLVRLSNVDENEDIQLIWQGFLLPDQYREEWKNGVFFPAFTAVDMISSLKGKYFQPWYYYQKFSMAEIFSMILKMTGLDQDFIVRPSIVNSSPDIGWNNLIVNLQPYAKEGKYTEVFKILEDILFSQGLQLKSYRGKWFIEGFTRKGETEGIAMYFDADGQFLGTANDPRYRIEVLHSDNTVNLNSVTPLKAVEVGFSIDEEKNLFPDDVLQRKSQFVGYSNDGFIETTPATTYFKQWKKFGTTNLAFTDPERKFSFAPLTSSDNYGNSIASSLINYFECPEKPFLKSGITYEIEIAIELKTLHGGIVDYNHYLSAFKNGYFDSFVMFQMFLDGVEIRSNVPGSSTDVLNQFDERIADSAKSPGYSFQGNVYILECTSTFKIKRQFGVGSDGYLSFRILKPYSNSGFPTNSFWITPKILKLTQLDGTENENITAVRAINFTQKKSFDLPITSSYNASIPNNYGLSGRIGQREISIFSGNPNYNSAYTQIFPPLNNLTITTQRIVISADVSRRVFDENKTKSIFLTKNDGTQKHFTSVYGKKVSGSYYMYALIDYEGRPFKPNDYNRMLPMEAGDELKMLVSDFATEDFTKREFWHVYGFPDWKNSYPKTLANAYHSVRKNPIFNIESTALAIVLPDNILTFKYDNVDREFIPTRIEIDLAGGKTTMNAKEKSLDQINDISYE